MPTDGALPLCRYQSKSSSRELFQLQRSLSKAQSQLEGDLVVGGGGVVGNGVGLDGPWKHQGVLETELSQQHPRAWHRMDEIPR